MTADRWVMGDQFGLELPADLAALRDGGAEFLTRALHAFGVLSADDRVLAVTGSWNVPVVALGARRCSTCSTPNPGRPPSCS